MGWRKELERTLSSHGLKITSIAGQGCGLITTRGFSPGEIIFSQEPYVATPHCYGCNNASYCTKSFERDDSKLHEFERTAISKFSVNQISPLSFQLVLKLLLKLKLQQDKLNLRNSTLGIDNYKLVAALKSRISELVYIAKLIKFLIPSLEFDLNEMIQFIGKVSHNVHAIYEPNIGYQGIGLFPVFSLINRSCMANSFVKFVGPIANVHAVEYIPPHAEVLLSSNDPDATTIYKNRHNPEAMFEGYISRDEDRNWMDGQDLAEF